MCREIEQVFFLLARWRELREILSLDDDVTGRAGHHALARAFERLARSPGDVEQPLSRFGFHFLVQGPVGPEEPHQCHATRCSCAFTAATIW